MKLPLSIVLAFIFAAGICRADRPPNVLLVITDDQGYGDLSLNGNRHLRTPSLDRFARESVRFGHFYVHPFCSPTRAAMLTGRHPLRTGVWGVTGDKETMRAQETTLAETLRAAGYRTGCFGKWHNGMQHPHTPTGQGFEEFFGFCGGHWNDYFDPALTHNGREVQTSGYIADLLTDRAIEFMRRHQDEPFLCYVPYNTPHSPDQLPDRYFDEYKAAGLDDHTAAAYGMCQNIDDNFARLLAALDELGLTGNTIVLFLTDNGPNGQRYNAGLRGTKGSVFDGGCRVPLFVRWPGRLGPRIVESLAAHIDLYPTLLDLCGVPLPAGVSIDGTSLRPLLEGRASDWPGRTLFTQSGMRGWQQRFPAAVRRDRFRAVRDSGDWQLYDIFADPGQKDDIASQKPDLLAELAAAYENWYADVSAGGWTRPPIPIGYEQENPVTLLATQAMLDKPIRFHAGPAGFANDWITGWTDPGATVRFEVDVKLTGPYHVKLQYSCPAADAGSRIRLSAGGRSVEATVAPADPRDVPLRTRDRDKLYANRIWATMEMGTIELATGRSTLTLQALSKPGAQVLDLKAVILRR